MHTTIRSLAALGLVALAMACSGSDSTGPGGNNGGGNNAPHTVTIANFAFSPDTLTVTAGTTVTFKNNDTATHTATADGGSFDTGNLVTGASATHTFGTAGVFTYKCAIHPSMKGAIKVQ